MKAQSDKSESAKRKAELLEAELIKLAAEGKLRLGAGAIDEAYWKLKIPRVKSFKSSKLLLRLIDEERNED